MTYGDAIPLNKYFLLEQHMLTTPDKLWLHHQVSHPYSYVEPFDLWWPLVTLTCIDDSLNQVTYPYSKVKPLDLRWPLMTVTILSNKCWLHQASFTYIQYVEPFDHRWPLVTLNWSSTFQAFIDDSTHQVSQPYNNGKPLDLGWAWSDLDNLAMSIFITRA